MIIFPFCLLDLEWYYFRRQIKEQKECPPSRDEHGWYYITILHKGESLLYTDKHGSTMIDFEIRTPSWVSASSIKRWSRFWKISDQQRKLILDRIVHMFGAHAEGCKIID